MLSSGVGSRKAKRLLPEARLQVRGGARSGQGRAGLRTGCTDRGARLPTVARIPYSPVGPSKCAFRKASQQESGSQNLCYLIGQLGKTRAFAKHHVGWCRRWRDALPPAPSPRTSKTITLLPRILICCTTHNVSVSGSVNSHPRRTSGLLTPPARQVFQTVTLPTHAWGCTHRCLLPIRARNGKSRLPLCTFRSLLLPPRPASPPCPRPRRACRHGARQAGLRPQRRGHGLDTQLPQPEGGHLRWARNALHGSGEPRRPGCRPVWLEWAMAIG